MKKMNAVRKFGSKLGAKVAVGAVLLGGASVALADSAAAVTAMQAKQGDIDAIGWAAVGLCVAVAVFGYVKRAAR